MLEKKSKDQNKIDNLILLFFCRNSTMFKPKKIGVRHEPDDSLRYVEDQNSIATSSNFEKCPNNKLEQSIYQDQVSYL